MPRYSRYWSGGQVDGLHPEQPGEHQRVSDGSHVQRVGALIPLEQAPKKYTGISILQKNAGSEEGYFWLFLNRRSPLAMRARMRWRRASRAFGSEGMERCKTFRAICFQSRPSSVAWCIRSASSRSIGRLPDRRGLPYPFGRPTEAAVWRDRKYERICMKFAWVASSTSVSQCYPVKGCCTTVMGLSGKCSI